MGRKLLSLVLGFTIGALIGSMLVLLFAPTSGKELRNQLGEGYKDTLKRANDAGEKRRAELEAELAQLRGKSSA